MSLFTSPPAGLKPPGGLLTTGVFILATGLLATGCAKGTTEPRRSPPRSSPAASTATPLLRKLSIDQLRKHPCLALDARDRAALGITGKGEEEGPKNKRSCHWVRAGQQVGLDLDVPLSYAKTMTKHGRVSQVPVGRHSAVQSEFQGICFIFVAIKNVDHLIGTTTIPKPGVDQAGTCPAGAAVAAAALSHIE